MLGMSPLLPAEAVMEATPSVSSLLRQGDANFRANKLDDSYDAFQRALAQDARIKPFLWQLGITEYALGKYEACSEQFKSDVSVNPRDTEEVVWALLCDVAGSNHGDLDTARKKMLLLQQPDPRPIMSLVYKTFQGQLPINALQEAQQGKGDSDVFYAKLYSALLADAQSRGSGDQGRIEEARQKFKAAIDTKYAEKSNDYMISVARVLSLATTSSVSDAK